MRAPSHRLSECPAAAGIGLRAAHYRDVLGKRPQVGFLEVHSENFFGVGGQPMAVLERARDLYPISLHGVGLSLGSAEPLSREHLKQLKALVDHIDPWTISDHLAWVGIDGRYANDLLPLPLTQEALRVVIDHVNEVQDALGRAILVENPSTYVAFCGPLIPEPEFLDSVVSGTGCRLLLDVNNIYVSAVNLGFDAEDYLRSIRPGDVAEIHLAGHVRSAGLLIDTHSRPVSDAVWRLYAGTINRFGSTPTLIEWDAELPPLDRLLEEAAKADAIRRGSELAEADHDLAA